ncbi:UTP--glucose-1-phosphate uridylyltransferase [Candidatus Kaiserbacteria bacterium RIFCSPHIGHO2_12_FULL_53_13]|uniref:UTP--glucose-1-phosphate uridylyltransferase n=1 Tax=Candidatus Kaiserbacteria bacterium RIFCSPHIGHO2_12_FULL_53_13 TaxID=1798502 RepID=A0A1F6EBX3_9BACT|nr:MAG: UTP--glucose-1-phosphate uridylyltransferase [Candidatus Kaiserbacteria bacterium RIFCSPHIGHO2_12_FULL_53_13]OGG74601.1 MAG: UTP--glucose-1-phosphate uridylyltransferase [Candidatus Kaiserbacteria bacterium RIFCSPLOWO2_01_FULL_52_36]
MSKKVRKAVIPAAGLGTRFLPATKAMPKEMLPIVDKPIIQYVVEEAVASGIEEIIIVTGWNKRSIEDHFDYPFELEKRLLEVGKAKEAEEVRNIANLANFVYIRQKGPYGNGTPVLNAKSVIGDEPFAVLWGDEFIYSDPPRLKQMMDVWEKHGVPSISAVRVPEDAVGKYGIADVTPVEPGIFKINSIVEKPGVGEAPSNLATHGAYIMTPRLFEILEETPTGKNGELWLVDAISALAKEQDVYAVEIQNGKYYDTGNKLEYLKTVVEFGLKHPDLNGDFRDFIKDLKL